MCYTALCLFLWGTVSTIGLAATSQVVRTESTHVGLYDLIDGRVEREGISSFALVQGPLSNGSGASTHEAIHLLPGPLLGNSPDEGEPPSPSTDESHYLKEDEVLEAILQDLMNKDKVAEKDRRFVRYFSTANLFNAMLIEMKLLEGRLAGEGSFSTSSRILGYLGEVTAKNFAKKAYEQLREKNLKTYQRGLSMLLNSSTAEGV